MPAVRARTDGDTFSTAPARTDGAVSPAPYHDELFDDDGAIRPLYAATWKIVSEMTPKAQNKAMKKSLKEFQGDNALHPLPRILPREERDALSRGVDQRGTALRMFLEDYHAGNQAYTKVIPQHVVERIAARNHEACLVGLPKPGTISFPYGPDVMRARDGKFYVIEDNPGFIGGPGDLLKARHLVFKLNPELRTALTPIDEPSDYFADLVGMAKAQAKPQGGRIVMYMTPPYADNESKRTKKAMKELGVEVITHKTAKQLVATKEGVWLFDSSAKKKEKKLERVGFVFLNGEPKWLDATHPCMREAYILSEAEEQLAEELPPKVRAPLELAMKPKPSPSGEGGKVDVAEVEATLKRLGLLRKSELRQAENAAGLVDCILAGKVATDYTPGVDFVGDKEFKAYVDDLVRFYLKAEPILPSIPVERFVMTDASGIERADEAAFAKYFQGDAYRDYVFKVVDGRGGKGVYIGPEMTPADAKAVEEKIRERPDGFVVEPFTPLSRLDGHIVDVRLLSTVTPQGVIVSPTPWSRGAQAGAGGKVNLSDEKGAGREFAVIVVDNDGARVKSP